MTRDLGYGAVPLAAETVPGELSGEWISRPVFGTLEVTDDRGRYTKTRGLTAIELVYCPITKSAETVCRTAVVWQVGKNEYLDPIAGPQP